MQDPVPTAEQAVPTISSQKEPLASPPLQLQPQPDAVEASPILQEEQDQSVAHSSSQEHPSATVNEKYRPATFNSRFFSSFCRLSRLQQSVPNFIKFLNEKTEQKRKADQLRFQVLQECVAKLGRNLELEAEKRMRTFEDLKVRMNEAFSTVLSTAQDEYEARSKDMELVCETTSQRLSKYGFLFHLYITFSFIFYFVQLLIFRRRKIALMLSSHNWTCLLREHLR